MTHRLTFAAAFLCASLSHAALAEVVQTKERTYAVKYKDGAVERFKIAWTVDVTSTFREQGGSPVPYQGSVNNFKCSWSIATTIERTASLATRLGPAFPLPAMTKTFKRDFQNPGSGELVVEGSRNESCKDAAPQRESAIAEARASSRALFERLTEADLESLRKETQANPDVASVAVQ